jgi:hypothetical protein
MEPVVLAVLPGFPKGRPVGRDQQRDGGLHVDEKLPVQRKRGCLRLAAQQIDQEYVRLKNHYGADFDGEEPNPRARQIPQQARIHASPRRSDAKDPGHHEESRDEAKEIGRQRRRYNLDHADTMGSPEGDEGEGDEKPG